MKIFFALVLGIILGVAGLWLFSSSKGRTTLHTTSTQVESAAKSARDAIEQKMQAMNLKPEDIKADLAKTGTVVRRKAREAGTAIADATADARVTAAIKGKLLASSELSALSISVDTTGGLVTLSGRVDTAEQISKAMLVALETDGVREVISTLQVRSKSPESVPAVNVRTQLNNARK